MSKFNLPSTKTSFLYLLSEEGIKKIIEQNNNAAEWGGDVLQIPPLIHYLYFVYR